MSAHMLRVLVGWAPQQLSQPQCPHLQQDEQYGRHPAEVLPPPRHLASRPFACCGRCIVLLLREAVQEAFQHCEAGRGDGKAGHQAQHKLGSAVQHQSKWPGKGIKPRTDYVLLCSITQEPA